MISLDCTKIHLKITMKLEILLRSLIMGVIKMYLRIMTPCRVTFLIQAQYKILLNMLTLQTMKMMTVNIMTILMRITMNNLNIMKYWKREILMRTTLNRTSKMKMIMFLIFAVQVRMLLILTVGLFWTQCPSP